MKTLKERFVDWLDSDIAAYEFGVTLGLWPEFGTDPKDGWGGRKWIFWSANPLGDNLHRALDNLVLAGILEKNDDGFRWNPNYSGS